jgi:ABC-type transport system substrate-binding protein
MFTFTRHYQYLVVLNSASGSLRPKEVRRALNAAVDRATLVKEALRGHGVVSAGPISSRYWALRADAPRFLYDPSAAANTLRTTVRGTKEPIQFRCLVPPDAVNERIALELKRQLQAVGVQMSVEEAPQDHIIQRIARRDYEAALLEGISGPTLLRSYYFWHSNTTFNSGGIGNATVDGALDRVREADTDAGYIAAVSELQNAFIEDPPAIFLAWSVRARAISKRFDVEAEEGRDVLSTIRMWKPTGVPQQASRN